MDIRKLLQYEIEKEKERINYFLPFCSSDYEGRLSINKGRGPNGQLYIIDSKGGKRFVNADLKDEAESIRRQHFANTSIRVLESNLGVLEKAATIFQPYDTMSINSMMSPAYRYPINDPTIDSQVHQSENPAYTEQLKYYSSFGLKVRSKNELLICEQLGVFKVTNYYEKALEVLDRGVRRTLFPDFSIPFADGRTLYWEHMGGFDNPKYANDNLRKIQLYYENGIYMPNNLIITMDSEDKPISVNQISRIIECLILPYI